MSIKNLKLLRKEKSLTQLELAKKISTTQRTYCDYENGRTEPCIDDLIKLADIFDVSIDYLVGRTDDFGIVKDINNLTLNEEENELLQIFKLLNGEDKDAILSFCRHFALSSKNINISKNNRW